jgi:uncharacterized protein
MLVNISAIKDQRGASVQESLQETLDLELSGGAALSGPVSISAEVTHTGKAFHVRGKAEGHFRADCDRCLKSFEAPFHSEFQGDFVRMNSAGRNGARTDFEVDNDLYPTEDDLYQFQGDEIDLAELVTEAILLAIPMKYLCRTDCKGLCPICGTPIGTKPCGCIVEEINPKFEALRKLLGREEV